VGGSNSRCRTPPNSAGGEIPPARRVARAGHSGQQTTGPHAPAADTPAVVVILLVGWPGRGTVTNVIIVRCVDI